MKELRLIALTGAANSGKTWAAARLCQAHGFTLVRFSDTIKRMLMVGFEIPEDRFEGFAKSEPLEDYFGLTTLEMMQALGYQGGRRALHEDIWIVPWRRAVERTGGRVVVDDLRWPNEDAAVRALGGTIWEVERPLVSNDRMVSGLTRDALIHNATTLDALIRTTDAAIREYLSTGSASQFPAGAVSR